MKKFNILIILLIALFFVCSCKGKEDEPEEIDWDSKTIANVEMVTETFEKEYEYDEFNLSDLKLKVTYTDNTSREIEVTDLMLSDKDVEKTKKAGNPRITIEYDAFTFTTTIKLVDSSLLDEDLNKSGEYVAVIKAIRNQENNTVDFIIESYGNITGLNFTYKYDNSVMQLSDAKINESLKGVGKVVVEDGKITFIYADSTPITTETVLFTVNYSGDFRNSELGVDLEATNILYVVDLETFTTKEASNVLYHASVK